MEIVKDMGSILPCKIVEVNIVQTLCSFQLLPAQMFKHNLNCFRAEVQACRELIIIKAEGRIKALIFYIEIRFRLQRIVTELT